MGSHGPATHFDRPSVNPENGPVLKSLYTNVAGQPTNSGICPTANLTFLGLEEDRSQEVRQGDIGTPELTTRQNARLQI